MTVSVQMGLARLSDRVRMIQNHLAFNYILLGGTTIFILYRMIDKTKHQDLENRTRNTFQLTTEYHNNHTHRQIPNYKVNNRMPMSPFDSDYSSGQDITKARGVF